MRDIDTFKHFLWLMTFALIGVVAASIFTQAMSMAQIKSERIYLIAVNSVASILIFGLPPIMAAKKNGKTTISRQLALSRPTGKNTFISAIIFVVVAYPLISLCQTLNENIHLPQTMQSIEEWIRSTEATNNRYTQVMLEAKNIWDLLLNIITIAIIPAVVEELMFRGFFLQKLKKATSVHMAVWVSAIIFSAIHMQFLGFIPRMLLGAAFGYITIWTKSLWTAIIAHFTNNFISIILVYLTAKNIIYLDNTNKYAFILYIFSAILSVLTLRFIRKGGDINKQTKHQYYE